jgi:hypothetical protein
MIFPFKRFVSYIVLLSFFVQTIWPSVAFAATDIEIPRPSSPLGFRFGASKVGGAPQLDFEVLSYDGKEADPDDSPPSSPRSVFQRTFQPTDTVAALAPLLVVGKSAGWSEI